MKRLQHVLQNEVQVAYLTAATWINHTLKIREFQAAVFLQAVL